MIESQARKCGRPTKSGNPCKARVHGPDVACGIHSTEQDRAVAEAYRRGYEEGRESGARYSKESSKIQIASLERQVKELRKQLDKATRIYEVGGDQVVDTGGYAYRWSGETPLEVGDRVLLPENYVSRMKHGPGPVEAVVRALGTTYQGPLSSILRRLDRK